MKIKDVLIQSETSYNKGKIFNEEASIVYTVFNSNLQKFDTEKLWRVSIRLSSNKGMEYHIEDLGEVIKIYRFLDFENYWIKSISDRKLIVLDLIYSTLVNISDKYLLPLKVIEEAYQLTIKQKIKYEGFWGDTLVSKDEIWKGRIYLTLDVGEGKIESEIENLDTGRMIKTILAVTKPHYVFR